MDDCAKQSQFVAIRRFHASTLPRFHRACDRAKQTQFATGAHPASGCTPTRLPRRQLPGRFSGRFATNLTVRMVGQTKPISAETGVSGKSRVEQWEFVNQAMDYSGIDE